MNEYRILALGDVVGDRVTDLLCRALSGIRQETGADLVIVNAENTAAGGGNGTTPAAACALLSAGADVLTGGNHTFARREYYDYLDTERRALRPANLPGACPGDGSVVVTAGGVRVLCINLLGRVYMSPDGGDPFACADAILRRENGKFDLCVVDFHAEATAEKGALARYLDGRISALFGTHTHVPTADARVLPQGTGFITDVGMCGPSESILGVSAEPVIRKFTTQMPTKFTVPQDGQTADGVLFRIDRDTKKTALAERVSFRL